MQPHWNYSDETQLINDVHVVSEDVHQMTTVHRVNSIRPISVWITYYAVHSVLRRVQMSSDVPFAFNYISRES